MNRRSVLVALALGAPALVLFSAERGVHADTTQGLTVQSPAFTNGGAIPAAYTCDGAGKSPPLSWSSLPAGTRSVAVVVDDPDAPKGTFVHWVLFDLPAGATALDDDAAHGLPAGAAQGKNGKGQEGWTPPCPPSGVHHYHFKVFALRAPLTLAQPSEDDLLRAMQGRVLGRGEIVGTYARAKR